jgi:uncharacterized membrane protein
VLLYSHCRESAEIHRIGVLTPKDRGLRLFARAVLDAIPFSHFFMTPMEDRSSLFPAPPLPDIHLSDADLEYLAYLRQRQPARSAAPPQFSRGDRIADAVSATVGSWRFIIVQSSLLAIWICLNVTAWVQHWDPYPFILLNLALSFQAAYATPFILMSQNRQSNVDRQKAQQDLDCDLKAEMEIELLHNKLDSLRAQEIADLKTQLDRQYEVIQRLAGLLEPEISANHPETIA